MYHCELDLVRDVNETS